jgi:DNA-binding response OmpR family regulator
MREILCRRTLAFASTAERPVQEHDPAQRVMIVDDSPEILAVLSRGLVRCGYQVATYPDGESALRSLRRENPHLIVLDLQLSDPDGVEVCMRVREWSSVPIIMLAERDSAADRVQGLRAGADDCITKPFSLDELVARIEAVLRRHPREQRHFEFEDLVVDMERHLCLRAGHEIDLTPTEFALLETLARLPERVISRRTLASAVWPQSDFVDDSLLDTHVTNLRKKLEAAGGRRLVQTVRGIGFTIR